MTADQGPRARKPQDAPTAADLAERDEYANQAAGSAEAVRGTAKTWETALTAFITLITAGVIIKGRDSTTDLTAGWRVFIVVTGGGGLLLAVAALWQMVAAEAGTRPEKTTLREIREAHGTLHAYQVHLAVVAARRLRWGLGVTAVAIALLIAGIFATWLAPAAPSPPTYLEITHGSTVTCGTPVPAPRDEISLSLPGQQTPDVLPLSQITAFALTATCPQ